MTSVHSSPGSATPPDNRNDSKSPLPKKVSFLVAANLTEDRCLMTSSTTALQPDVHHTQEDYIHVGKCDFGPLDYKITTSRKLFRCCFLSRIATFQQLTCILFPESLKVYVAHTSIIFGSQSFDCESGPTCL